jgi:hypothetical protein
LENEFSAKQELARRDTEYLQNPGIAISWDAAGCQMRGQSDA